MRRLWYGRARVRPSSRSAEIKSHFNLTVFSAPTRVIELENTLNGTIIPQKDVLEISKNAHARDIIMHLDGARVWHVAVETGLSMNDICDPFDSVSLCLSKGLGKISPISFFTCITALITVFQVRQSEHVWSAQRPSSPRHDGSGSFLAAECVRQVTWSAAPPMRSLTTSLFSLAFMRLLNTCSRVWKLSESGSEVPLRLA